MAKSSGNTDTSPREVTREEPEEERFLAGAPNVREITRLREGFGNLLTELRVTDYITIETRAPKKGRRGWSLWLHVSKPPTVDEQVVAWLHRHREAVDELIARMIENKYKNQLPARLAALTKERKP